MLLDPLKFTEVKVTAKGEPRAYVDFDGLDTLWFNTGTQCNLTCSNCYIESSPKNDRLVYLTEPDVREYLEEIRKNNLPTKLIAFTGGEPFLNPNMIPILRTVLGMGFDTLVLTNGYVSVNKCREALVELRDRHPGKLKLRVSLDHYTKEVHEAERGRKTFEKTTATIAWLASEGFKLSVAGRSLTEESAETVRSGYRTLLENLGVRDMNYDDPEDLVVFPEMDAQQDVAEITTSCWEILGKSPKDIMCANSRMIVKRKGAPAPTVMACTLIAYDTQFELGRTLEDGKHRVYLNHPSCASFCVLGGASCA